VLALICEVLRLVPLEPDSAHYNNITTNMALYNTPSSQPDFPVSASCELEVR
jgi:hypothetical protein